MSMCLENFVLNNDKNKNKFRSNDVTLASEDRRRVTEKGVFSYEQKSASRMIRLMNGQHHFSGKTTDRFETSFKYAALDNDIHSKGVKTSRPCVCTPKYEDGFKILKIFNS